MKMKNVNFVQKHIEKVILGLAVALALAIVALYALGSPYTAKIGNQELGPRSIEEKLKDEAQNLRVKLANETPQFEPPAIAPYHEELAVRLAGTIGPPGFPLIAGAPGVNPKDLGVTGPIQPYLLPRPPLAVNIEARDGYAVLGQFPEEQAELNTVFHDRFARNKQPADIRYVSVAADWPIVEWQNRLASSPDLPAQFWRSMVYVSAVYLQREELDPLTNAWGNPTIIEPLPGQIAFTPTHEEQFNDESAAFTVQGVRDTQANITRSEFPPLAVGLWLPPGSDFGNLNAEQQGRLRDLREDIASLETRIERLRTQVQRQAEAAQRRTTPPTRTAPTRRETQGPPPGAGRPGRGGDIPTEFSPPTPGPGPGGANNNDAAAQLERMIVDLQQKRVERDELVGVPQDVLTDATQQPTFPPDMYGEGFDPSMMGPYGPYGPTAGPYGPPQIDPRTGRPIAVPPGAGRPGMPGRPGAQPAQPRQPDPDANTDVVRVWAHDLTVEPGKIYRYRVVVAVLNPLFRQNKVNEEQKREMFNQIALGPDEGELSASPWSEPVHVDPEYYFFFLSGAANAQLARVEVWRIYNGQWVNTLFLEQPGDQLGGNATVEIAGEPTEIPMDTGAVMVDLVASGGSALGGDTRLLYLDPTTGQIASRSSQQDQRSQDRIRLENEREVQASVATSASTTP